MTTEKADSLNMLPAGWCRTSLESLVEILDSMRVPLNATERERRIAGKAPSELFPYFGATGKVGEIDAHIFDEPLILVGEDGAPFLDPLRNKAYLVDGKCWVNNHAHVLKSIDGLSDRRFIANFLNFVDYRDFVTGTTRLKLTQAALRSIPVPVPPLTEQKRIADKLDRLLARVDACRERLDRVPALLKRFRQSVLVAATSGELTREWRAARLQESEIGAGLPSTWDERKIGDLGKVQLGRQRSPKFHTGDSMRPYLRVQNVFEDRIDISDVMEMNFPPDDISRYELKYGDILLNEGQSPQYLGRPAMFRNEIPGACFTNTLIRFQAHRELVSPEYALLVFRHHMHSGRYVAEGNITTNIAHLGAGRFAAVEFPLPPLDEQTEIVRRTESLFEMASKLEARLQEATALAQRTTPATLAKAFRGELVPQDPTDEPAATLLARIAAARDDAGVPAKKRRRSSMED